MVAVNTKRVRTRAASPTFQSPSSVPSGAFGGGAGLIDFGRSVEGLGDDLGGIALEMAREDNETRAKEADARIAQRIRRVTLGDPGDQSAPPGYLHTQGRDTLGAYGAAEEAVRKAVEEELDDANPALRAMIQESGSRRVQEALDRMTGHATEQRLVVQEQASLAREAQAFADVSADWRSDEVLGAALGVASAEALDRAEAQGMGEEAAAQMVVERQSVMIKGAFDAALASSDVERAQAIFSKHVSKLDGATRTTMAQTLAEDVEVSVAQRLADEAMALGGTTAEKREYIRDAVDGKLRSVAIDTFNSMLAEERQDTRFALAMESARRQREAENRVGLAQEALDRMEAELGEGAGASEQREWIERNYDGKLREKTLSMLQTRVERERGDLSAARASAEEERVDSAQSVVDEVQAMDLDADAARTEITERLEGAVRETALTIFERELSRERGDDETRRAIEARTQANVRYMESREAAAREERVRVAMQEAHLFLDERGQDGSYPSVSDFRREHPDMYETLSGAGEVEGLRRTERLIKEGNIFATVSDGETFQSLDALPPEEKARLAEPGALLQYRRSLTESEYYKIITSINAAAESINSQKESFSLFRHGDHALEVMADNFGFDREGSKDNKRVFALARSAMQQWINERVQAGEKIEPTAMEAEAARLMMTIDVEEPGLDIFPHEQGIESFDGIAAEAGTLTPEERQLARVKFENIPDPVIRRLSLMMNRNGYGTALAKMEEADWEQIAGWYAVGETGLILDFLEDKIGE